MAESKAKMNAGTIWPELTKISKPTKEVMKLLLDLLDDKSDNAGDRMADEVFTPDGYLGAFSGAAKGSAGTNSRIYLQFGKNLPSTDFKRNPASS